MQLKALMAFATPEARYIMDMKSMEMQIEIKAGCGKCTTFNFGTDRIGQSRSGCLLCAGLAWAKTWLLG